MRFAILTAFVVQDVSGYCNVCRLSSQGTRYLTNPSQSWQMNGKRWTCGYLQDTVQDVYPTSNNPTERSWCSLAQIMAEDKCSCGGPSIPPTTDNIKDLNPACNICQGQALNFVPKANANLVADTKVAGRQNCEGLYHAASAGVLSSRNCPIVSANAGPTCCNIDIPTSAVFADAKVNVSDEIETRGCIKAGTCQKQNTICCNPFKAKFDASCVKNGGNAAFRCGGAEATVV